MLEDFITKKVHVNRLLFIILMLDAILQFPSNIVLIFDAMGLDP